MLLFQVFYIDYGNTEPVELDNLYEWEEFCDSVPAQAIFCRLASIRRVLNVSDDICIDFLHHNYLNKVCKALIV